MDMIILRLLNIFFLIMVVFAAGLTAIATFKATGFILEKTNCTTSQLHQVIEKVELCKKQNVICSIDAKDKIIYEVCK